MKQLLITTFALIMAVLQISAHPSASHDGASVNGQSITEYTIMFYGNGNGDLDRNIINNINQIYNTKGENLANIKVAMQYRFSRAAILKTKGIFTDPEKCKKFGSASCRFVLDPQQSFETQIEDSRLEKILDIDDPKNLTDFINWAKKECPAKHYVLILSGHGSGYVPDENIPYSRRQPNKNFDLSHLSLISMVEGVRASGIHFDVVYWDACLMNTMECIFEQQDLTDYLIVSTFNVPGMGGDYTAFVSELANTQQGIENSLKNFVKRTSEMWRGKKDIYTDLTVLKTSRLDLIGQEFAKFVNILVDQYKKIGRIDHTYSIENFFSRQLKINPEYPFYPYKAFSESLSVCLSEYGKWFSPINQKQYYYNLYNYLELEYQFTKSVIAQEYSNPSMKEVLSMGMGGVCSVLCGFQGQYIRFTWNTIEDDDPNPQTTYVTTVNSASSILNGENEIRRKAVKIEYFKADGTKITCKNMKDLNDRTISNWGGTFENTYKQLKFDKITGWSRWMEVNQKEPSIMVQNVLFDMVTEDEVENFDLDEYYKMRDQGGFHLDAPDDDTDDDGLYDLIFGY